MNLFQLMMLGAAAFFAYKVYLHIQSLEEPTPNESNDEVKSEIDFTKHDTQLALADSALESEKYDEAIEQLKNVLDIDDRNTETLNKLAFAYSKLGDTRNGLKYYERSLSLDDSDDVTHLAFASLLKEIREYDKAQEHYLRAIKIDDTYEITYFNYANLLVEMGEIDEAKVMYKRAINLKADFNQAKFELEKLA